MRPRDRILSNLEALYREAYGRAADADDEAQLQQLDFDFRRDQLFLESVLDVRDLLGTRAPAKEAAKEPSLMEQVGELRQLTRLPFGR